MPDKWIALSYPEWLRWIATGQLIVRDRMRPISGQDDQSSFNEILNLAPDTGFGDGGYILAQLDSRFLTHDNRNEYPLKFAAVLAFHPVSERGQRLLVDDAKRAGIQLSPPIFENLWDTWAKERDVLYAEIRGSRLAEAFGFVDLSIDWDKFGVIREFCHGQSPCLLPNEEKAEKYKLTLAFAWAGVFGVITKNQNDNERKKISRELGFNNVINEFKKIDARRSPCLADRDFKTCNAEQLLNKMVEAASFPCVRDLHVLLVTLHYRSLFFSEADVDEKLLIRDIAEVKKLSDQSAAGVTASAIGQAMPDEAVTSLWLASPLVKKNFVSARSEVLDLSILGVSSSNSDNSKTDADALSKEKVNQNSKQKPEHSKENMKEHNADIKCKNMQNDAVKDTDSLSQNAAGTKITPKEQLNLELRYGSNDHAVDERTPSTNEPNGAEQRQFEKHVQEYESDSQMGENRPQDHDSDTEVRQEAESEDNNLADSIQKKLDT